LAVFEEMIGPYPFDKLANVQSTTRYGGMENASCIFYAENSVTGTRSSESLIAHEIAHQWFGNSASESDWMHVWLSEGFATYFTHLYFEKVYGKEKMQERMAADRKKVIAFEEKYGQNSIVDPKVNSLEDLLSPISYEKAAWVLHMMRQVMGDKKFFAGIREYYATYAFGNASTTDFMKIMEKHGGPNVMNYFENWLKYGGFPILTVTKKEKGNNGIVTIEAIQTSGRKTIPLTVRIVQNGQVIREQTIRMDSKMEITFPKQKGDYEVVLDPYVQAFFKMK
jgi:aminopeptidase N